MFINGKFYLINSILIKKRYQLLLKIVNYMKINFITLKR